MSKIGYFTFLFICRHQTKETYFLWEWGFLTTFAHTNHQSLHIDIMKEFLRVLRRFVPPYKKYLVLTVVFNILSAVLNIFSFMALVPILQILFQTKETQEHFEYMAWGSASLKDVAMNNMNYYVQEMIGNLGPTTTLLFIGLFLAVMTALKTGAYFLSSATIVPIRTGVVRDIRNQLYQKITSLPLGFFSEERKGDIIARMSGDVQEI